MSALREDREAAASPLLAIHERLDQLVLGIAAIVTAIDPEADEAAILEAAETLTKIRTAAAKIKGHDAAGSPGEWLSKQRAIAKAKPFLSTDRRPRRERVVVDGLKVTTDVLLAPDGTVVGYDEGT